MIFKMNPERIRYLSFEGGGGKGAAYLGALAALAELPKSRIFKETQVRGTVDYVLNKDQIKGVAGASAGAITAAFLASGHGLRYIYNFATDTTTLNGFYDKAVPGETPRVSPAVRTPHYRPPVGPKELISKTKLVAEAVKCLVPCLYGSVVEHFQEKLSKFGQYKLDYSRFDPEAEFEVPYIPKKLLERLVSLELKKLLECLVLDYGFFSGLKAKAFFSNMIGERPRIQVRTGSSGFVVEEFTFERFDREKAIHLVVTGTDIEKGVSKYFSLEYTKDFPVADALRISISFPYLFKPVVIDKKAGGGFNRKYGGTWIDGGVLNNNPIHAFDHYDQNGNLLTNQNGNLFTSKEDLQTSKLNPGMLGFRLDENANRTIDNLVDYTFALVGCIIDSVTELGQFHTEEEQDHTIALDVSGLKTTNFSPPEKAIKRAIERSYYDTCAKFSNHPKSKQVLKRLEIVQ
jgi:predicted acylesterase/phospholipase RssA